jgi:hypothetical protein
MAAMNVDKGRLIKVNANDGFDLAHLLSQARPTDRTTGVVNLE